ncbi:MAG TPA: 2-isopropylmalate synthase [Candidatus Limisoma gallistercoris]|nr:2-isopropylmalate synthase [Candidatus Limisoma gallistercoris]
MDTTLRDGEQTTGVSFTRSEKLSIFRLLVEELHIPRVEVASARVSSGEFETVKRICEWAKQNGHLDKVEVLGFIDGGQSNSWVRDTGAKKINLLCKGSERHCRIQLEKSPEAHIADVKEAIADARSKGLEVNLYLEDWSNGMKDSQGYVFRLMDSLREEPVGRFMLPDTLGVLDPYDTFDYVKKMIKTYPELRFDFHAHNDYDLAISNLFAALKVGASGVHCTINGLGERAGNAPLSSAIAVIHDMLHLSTGIDETKINRVSGIVESYSGVAIPPNKPIIGEYVFTQCAGVHADGDSKADLYSSKLAPERFGRTREYALGKLSGKANIRKNLEALGLELSEEKIQKVAQRITELGDKKEIVTQEDLPFIVADVVKHGNREDKIKLVNYQLSIARGLRPTAVVKIEINGKEYMESSVGDGQYDAFMKALRKIYRGQRRRDFPTLTNYTVNIPRGGKTDALVQTTIHWQYGEHLLKTIGLDADQTESAIKATIKMLNVIEEFK